jgi:hypothetical protein
MAEKSKSPPADEAAPAPVETADGSGAINDAETRPNAATAAEVAGVGRDEIEAPPPPTMTPSQRLAVLVAQTRLRVAQSAAEPLTQRAVQLTTEDPKLSLASVASGGRTAPAAVTTPAVPQLVEEAEPTEKDESPRAQGPAAPLIDGVSTARPLTALGSGRGVRVGLAAVLAGGLAWIALAWIVPRFRETRAPQTPEPGAHAPSSSASAVDPAPRKPSTPPTGEPSPPAPPTAVPADPAAAGPAERASEPAAHALPPLREEEEDPSPNRPSAPQAGSTKGKHDSPRGQPGQVKSSNTRPAHTRGKTKAAARPASSSKKDPDDVLPLLTR